MWGVGVLKGVKWKRRTNKVSFIFRINFAFRKKTFRPGLDRVVLRTEVLVGGDGEC